MAGSLVRSANVPPTEPQMAEPPPEITDVTAATAPADDRFGVILTENTFFQRSLQLMGIRWYLDYSFDVRGVPAGAAKALKVRANQSSTAEELQSAARRRPGSYWIVGNEPNSPAQDDLDPESYARVFNSVVATLKAADPQAKIVAPEILNFDATCRGCQGYVPGRGWLEAFRRAYLTLYGQEPPVDVWSIHTYDLDWTQLPQGDYQAQIREVAAFREYLSTLPEGGAKPIWVTEFSVVWAYDGIQWKSAGSDSLAYPVGALREDRLKDYLEGMVSWLRSNAQPLNIQRWFLFSSHPYREPWAAESGGLVLVQGAGPSAYLTRVGALYRQLAQNGAQRP